MPGFTHTVEVTVPPDLQAALDAGRRESDHNPDKEITPTMKTMKTILNHLRYWLFGPPSWKACTKASCWDGANASVRHMNNLSPKLGDDEFRRRVKWAGGRGCNTLHLFLANSGDGEAAGYSVADPDTARLMLRRVVWARKRGFGVVLWLIADDSPREAEALFADPARYAAAARPLLRHASAVVLGLEMDEGGSYPGVSARKWLAVRDALRDVYAGRVGTHHTSGRYDYAGLGDIVFAQCEPPKPKEDVSVGISRVELAMKAAKAAGKPVNFFELDRHPNRELAQAALDAGAFAVGNW